MSDIEITIGDWIKLPETQALERHYKELGMIEPDSSWDDFEIVPSVKAYETYKHVDTDTFKAQGEESRVNATYALMDQFPDADERLLKCMSSTLYSLRMAAISTKIEGCCIGEGKLIIQNRMPITITDDNDFNDTPPRKVVWRGAIFRIGDTYELR